MALKRDITLLKSISKKISEMRKKKYPGHGGITRCIRAFYGYDNTEDITNIRVKWSRWENGAAIPEDKEQWHLSQFFGITLGELRGESNSNQKNVDVLIDKGVAGDITYSEKGAMADSAGVEFLKDHLVTLKRDKADLQAKVALLEKEVADLREENKRLLTLSSVRDTTQAGSG